MSDIDELPSWAPKSEQPETVSAPAKTNGGGPGRGLLYALLAVLALVVVGGGGFMLLSGDDDGTETATGDDAVTTEVTNTPSSTSETTAEQTEAAAGETTDEGQAAEGEAGEAADGGEAATEPVDNTDGHVRHTEIRDGKYILNGTVPTQEMMDQIVAITENAAGAENVVNNLTIDPNSPAETRGYPVYMRDIVLFDLGSTEVREDYEHLLQAGATFLQQNEVFAITVVGYADASGSPEANQQISEARAEAVKAVYVSLGANPDQIFTLGRGDSTATEGASSSLAAEERRVEFYVGSVDAGPQEPHQG